MADAIANFFEELAQRGHQPLLGKVNGTLRIELLQDGKSESWLITIDKGDVGVSRRKATADSVVRTERSVFGALAAGRANAMAAFLRGEIEIEGDYHLLAQFLRMFPGPVRGGAHLSPEPSARSRTGSRGVQKAQERSIA